MTDSPPRVTAAAASDLGCVPFYERYRRASKEEALAKLTRRFTASFVPAEELASLAQDPSATVERVQTLFRRALDARYQLHADGGLEWMYEIIGGRPRRIPAINMLHEIIDDAATATFSDEQVLHRRLARSDPPHQPFSDKPKLTPIPAWAWAPENKN